MSFLRRFRQSSHDVLLKSQAATANDAPGAAPSREMSSLELKEDPALPLEPASSEFSELSGGSSASSFSDEWEIDSVPASPRRAPTDVSEVTLADVAHEETEAVKSDAARSEVRDKTPELAAESGPRDGATACQDVEPAQDAHAQTTIREPTAKSSFELSAATAIAAAPGSASTLACVAGDPETGSKDDVNASSPGKAAQCLPHTPGSPTARPESPLHVDDQYETALQPTLDPLKKREITILLTGETGTGKTTFMSLLANVCANRTVLEFVPEHSPENDSKLDASQSQTKAAMLYEMERYDGVLLRVLDTPGLCDTRGIDQDSLHKASIASAIRDHVTRLDAIIIMANGTNERLTVPTDYALNTLSAMFPASIAQNIGFLFTMVDNPLTWNFQPTSLPPCLHNAELWAIQNPLALVVKYREQQTLGRVTGKKAKVFEKILDDSYKTALDTLNAMFTWLDERVACPTTEIYDLYSKTIGIEAAITDVIARLHQTERQRDELENLRIQLEKSRQTMKINEKYEKLMRREMHVQKDTPDRHTTQCTVADCYTNCHQSCSLSFLLDPAQIGRDCDAFRRARKSRTRSLFSNRRDLSVEENALSLRCDECNHEARDHRHFHSYWALETKEELIVDEGAKRSYELAENDLLRFQLQMQRMERSLHTLDDEILAQQKRLSELCDEFQSIALSGNFAGHLASAIRMLEYRRASKKTLGDVDGERALTRIIDSLEEKIRVLRDTEEKKRQNRWSLSRIRNAVARWVPNSW